MRVSMSSACVTVAVKARAQRSTAVASFRVCVAFIGLPFYARPWGMSGYLREWAGLLEVLVVDAPRNLSRTQGYFTSSKSPGFQVLSNQGCRGAYNRSNTFQPFPGTVCTQLFSCPAGAFGPNHTVTEPSGFFLMVGWLLSMPASFWSVSSIERV